MTRDEQLARLLRIAPFDRLAPDELGLLLDFTTLREAAPGGLVHGGAAPPRLLIVLKGAVRDSAGAAVGPVIGLAAMFSEPSATPLFADAQVGASLASIDRQTFFTLAHSRPGMVRGFLQVGTAGAVLS